MKIAILTSGIPPVYNKSKSLVPTNDICKKEVFHE
jgi:hypothetical protein